MHQWMRWYGMGHATDHHFLGALTLLVAQPLAAAESAPLAPGKPAGVKPAQLGDLLAIYGGVAAFALYWR
jgi:hypothetical protein